MTFEVIKNAAQDALRNGDKLRRAVLLDMAAAIEKAATAGKNRVDITEQLVNDTLIKYNKTIQEMVDTCPRTEQYADKLAEYTAKKAIVEEYAPKVITDKNVIAERISYWLCQDLTIPTDNKGQFMKALMPDCKAAGFDMKVANQVLNELWMNKE